MNALWTKQFQLNERNLILEESIKQIKPRIESEKKEVESIIDGQVIQKLKITAMKDHLEATRVNIDVLTNRLIQWSNSVIQKEAILSAQKENQLLKDDLANNKNIFDSKILINNDDVELIQKWVGKKLKSIFYSTQFEFVLKLMIKGCGDYSPTLVIVKGRSDIIIGGYTSHKWSEDSNATDLEAFFFR